MPLNLNFRVEDRGGVMVVIEPGRTPEAPEVVRAATSPEVELWNALARRMAAPTRESYVRINEQDLVGLLLERDQLRRQVTDLQREKNELKSLVETLKGPEGAPKCKSCGAPARHQTVPIGTFFFCDEHIKGLRTLTEPVPT